MIDPLMINGKVCIITGAGKGIGLETAKLLVSLGCKLALITRNSEDLKNITYDLKIQNEDIFIMEGDVSDERTVISFVQQVYKKFNSIDILFNNAGIRFRKKLSDINYDEWKEVMNTNIGSTFLMCKEVGKHMKTQQSGKIINMSSVVGVNGLDELSAYSASKGAIISLTKSLAIEWANYNINVNVIAPGFCKTSYADNFKQKTDLYNFTIERTPMKRWGTSLDIANAVAFLASDMSSYITGETLSIDGGWNAW